MSDWPRGVDKRVLGEVDSTMDAAARLAPDLRCPTWILALKQTKGRGRRGRAWTDPAGNFTATLVLHPKEPPATVALRSFVSALALRDALVALTGREAAFTLKWPNDVLLHGGKLAGILLESSGLGDTAGVNYLAIGFGVNLQTVPTRDPGAAFPPVSLKAETGADISPEQFLEALAPAYARWELAFTTYGFEGIRKAWLAHAARLGEVITARSGAAEIIGTFQTVDEQGALVLKASGGIHHIAAADVFFGPG